MSTPCEKLGYEEGMQFTLVNDDVDGLSAGDTLWLHSDDGSSNPEFRDTEKVNDDTETYYIDLSDVARYTPNETLAYNRGLREGDILQMVMDDDGEEAYEGDIITFINDDGDTCPKFRLHKDDSEPYLYLSHVGGLEPKVGRKVRVIHNCTGGFSAGTEGIIVEICSDGDYCIAARGDTMYHHADSCIVFGYADDESPKGKDSEPRKKDWPTKPADEWKKGDKGIIRSTDQHDGMDFKVGDVVTKESEEYTTSSGSKDKPRARFKNSSGSIQWVELHLLEPIESDKPSELSGTKPTAIICDELADTSKKYKYFIDGDSIEVTLVGYFDGEPICAYKDRWGDTQLFIAKPSLLVEE